MVELVDALHSKSSSANSVGQILTASTNFVNALSDYKEARWVAANVKSNRLCQFNIARLINQTKARVFDGRKLLTFLPFYGLKRGIKSSHPLMSAREWLYLAVTFACSRMIDNLHRPVKTRFGASNLSAL